MALFKFSSTSSVLLYSPYNPNEGTYARRKLISCGTLYLPIVTNLVLTRFMLLNFPSVGFLMPLFDFSFGSVGSLTEVVDEW